MDEKTKLSLSRLLDYVGDAERKHWGECGRPENHIYRDVLLLHGWLNRGGANSPELKTIFDELWVRSS